MNKFNQIMTIPIIYLPLANLLDFRLGAPFPYFTIILLLISLFNLLLKVDIKKEKLDIIFLGSLIFISNTVITTLLFQFHSLNQSLLNWLSLLLLLINIMGYGRKVYKNRYMTTGMMMVYLFVALFTFLYSGLFVFGSFDLMTLRAGMYIFGSNTFLVFLLGFAIMEKMQNHIRLYWFFTLIYGLLTIVYVSRGNLLVFLAIILYELFRGKSITKTHKLLYLIALILSTVVFVNILNNTNPEVIERLFSSFELFQIENLATDNRASILEDSFQVLKNNPSSLILGIGIDNFRYINIRGYSDPHNFLLDLIFVGGIPLLVMVLFLIGKIFVNTDEKFLFSMFIILLIFEGIASLHFRASIKSTYIFLILIWMYYILITPKYDNNFQVKEGKVNLAEF